MTERVVNQSDHTTGWHVPHLPHTFPDLHAVEQHVVARLQEKRRARHEQQAAQEALTVGQRVADAVADTMGSWRFIIVQSVVLAIWVLLNVVGFVRHWDPYPFILLNLMLSFQAAYSAPFIMMSQNRQEAHDRMRAELDLETDVKAETLIEEIHLHMLDLRMKRWDELLEIQQRQIEMLMDLVTRAGGTAPPAAPLGPSATDRASEGDRGPALDL
jgi:uncharacterized membrane protein